MTERDAFGTSETLGDLETPPIGVDPAVDITDESLRPAEDAQTECLFGDCTRGARDLDRLGGHRACRDGVTAEQAQPGRLPERASAGRRRRVGRDEAQCLRDRRVSGQSIARPQEPPEPFVQETESDRVGSAVRDAGELGRDDRLLPELDRTVVGPRQDRALGRSLKDVAAIDGRPGGIVTGRQQVEGALIESAGFGERIHSLG